MKESQLRLEGNSPNYGKQFIICDIMRLCLFIHLVHKQYFCNYISDRCSQIITLIQIGSTAMVLFY